MKSEAGLAKKLQIKTGRTVAVLDAPAGYLKGLDLPKGTKAVTAPIAKAASFDVVQIFVGRVRDVALRAVKAGKLVKDDGAFWVAYPKKSSPEPVETDLSRDHGWESLNAAGWDVVSLVSLDATWSALRFKKAPELRAARRERATKKLAAKPAVSKTLDSEKPSSARSGAAPAKSAKKGVATKKSAPASKAKTLSKKRAR